MRPHADSAASAARFGRRAVSSSERPVSGRGRPPRPSSESTTIFVVFWTTSGAISSSIDRARSRLLHRVLEPPEPGDLHRDDVTRLEVHGRLLAEPDAGRRSGGDEIAGRERHQPREIAHEVADVEDERLRVAALHLLAVHPGPELEGVWVGDLLPVGDVGSDGRRSLEDLPDHPLARDELEVPSARVVDDRVPPHVVERLLSGDETRRAADDHAQLDPPVELLRAARPQDGLARVADRVRPLGEDRWLLGNRVARLFGVIPVVEADANELPRIGDRRVEASARGGEGVPLARGGSGAPPAGGPPPENPRGPRAPSPGGLPRPSDPP